MLTNRPEVIVVVYHLLILIKLILTRLMTNLLKLITLVMALLSRCLSRWSFSSILAGTSAICMDHLFRHPDKKKCSYVLASPPPRLVSCWLMGVSGCGRRRTNADLKLLIYAFHKVGLFSLFLIICQSFSSTIISITIDQTIITLAILSLINVLIYLWMNLSNSTRLRSIIVASRSTTKPI